MSEQENKTPEQKKEDKPAKKAEKRPNFFVRAGRKIAKWFRDLKSEAKKVVWPGPKQVRNNTVIVIAAILLVGIFVAVLDYGFAQIRDFIITLV